MAKTLGMILQYLEESKKVTVNKDGSCLVFPDSPKVKKVVKKSKRSTSRSR